MSSRNPESLPIDPRAPRFGAAVTTVVLGLTLVLGPHSAIAGLLLTVQLLVFASGAVLGLQAQPYGWLYRRFVRPSLSAPESLEDPAAPRFAQAVGLGFALVGAAGCLMNIEVLFYVPVAAAFAAAFLNAVFDYCLGCEIYLLFRRSTVADQRERERQGAVAP